MIKPTKRKAFNFLRSYFDVLNELDSDSDKLDFLMSIINKQFLNEDPKDLNFLPNLCYESQRHQIESSVKGWERASNDTLSTTPSTTPPSTPPTDPKEEEEKGEEEEKEKTIDKRYFLEFWDLYDKKLDKVKCEKKWGKIDVKTKMLIIDHVGLYVKSTPDVKFRKNPLTYLNGECWNDEVKSVVKRVVYNAQNF